MSHFTPITNTLEGIAQGILDSINHTISEAPEGDSDPAVLTICFNLAGEVLLLFYVIDPTTSIWFILNTLYSQQHASILLSLF